MAYIHSVAAASITWTLLTLGFVMFESGGFETATSNGILVKSGHLLFMTIVLTVIAWIVAFFTALIPYCLGIALAMKLKISHWAYFVTGGSLVGAGFIPIFLWMSDDNDGIDMLQSSNLHGGNLLVDFVFVFSGTLAGVTCWRYLHNRLHWL